MLFKASLDRLSRIITGLIGAVGLFMLAVCFFVPAEAFLYLISSGVLLPIIVVVAWFYSPQAYQVDPDQILILRKMGTVKIPRENILNAKTLSADELGMAWRVMGNGGVFGYTGWFQSRPVGRMRWYVTQRKNYVLLTLKKGYPILLSPDEPSAFVNALTVK